MDPSVSLNLKGKKDETNTALLVRRLNHYNKMKGIVTGDAATLKGGFAHTSSHGSHVSHTGDKGYMQKYSHDLMDSQPWHWDERKLGSFFLLLCRSNLFSSVLRALAIFDPENPLIDFVKFNRSFVQCRFEKSRELLVKFVECMRKRFRGAAVVDLDKEQVDHKTSSAIVPSATGASRYSVELFTNDAIWQLAEETIQWLLDDAT